MGPQNITTIREKEHVKFLGITQEKYVNWKAHIDAACGKLIHLFIFKEILGILVYELLLY